MERGTNVELQAQSTTYLPASYGHGEFDRYGYAQYSHGADTKPQEALLENQQQQTKTGVAVSELPYSFDAMDDQNQKLKMRIRRLKFLLRVAVLVFSLYDLATMGFILGTFLATKDEIRHVVLPDETLNRGPWAEEPIIWPTYVLMVTAAITTTSSVIVLGSYLLSVKAANKTEGYAGILGIGVRVAHAVVWIATAIAYRLGKSTQDAWGWSCSDGAALIQKDFSDLINFRALCKLQSSSWGASVAEAIIVTLTVLIYWYSFNRLQHQRKLYQINPEQYSATKHKWYQRWILSPK